MIVEAEDEKAFARGMQGLNIRIAKALNRVMGRHGWTGVFNLLHDRPLLND